MQNNENENLVWGLTKNRLFFWGSVFSLLGTIVGAGIFGLPYIFAKIGWQASLALFIFLAAIILFVHFNYVFVVLRTEGKHRLAGYAQIHLGNWAKVVEVFSTIIGYTGGLLVYGILAGIFLTLRAARLFLEKGTTHNPYGVPSVLLTIGPFSFSRNPMYLGMTLILLGAAVFVGAVLMFLSPIAFFLTINQFFIPREEKKRRWNILQKLMEKNTLKKNQKYLGKTVSVLVDGYEKGWYIGNSREMKRVRFRNLCHCEERPRQSGGETKQSPEKEKVIGKIINVKIKKALMWILED